MSMQKDYISCAEKLYTFGMTSVAAQLKTLRERTVPRLSIRSLAELLGVSSSAYAMYENPNRYKKSHLPVPLTRRIASIFVERGIDAAEVMKLAGLTDEEVAPEATAIEVQRPQIQHISMQVALPSEAALADMFEGLLALVPEGASRSEVARILARRLPSGFAALAPLLPVQPSAPLPATSEAVQSRATDHPAHGPASRT